MARQERNDVDYFPHPVNHGKKMHYILNKYKNDGYTVWFRLLEELGKASYHYLDLSDEIQLMYLSSTFLVTEEMLTFIISDLVKLEQFDKELYENKILFNIGFNESITDAYKKRNNNIISKNELVVLLTAKGRLKLSKSTPNVGKSTLEGCGNTQSKEEKRKEEKSIGITDSEILTHTPTPEIENKLPPKGRLGIDYRPAYKDLDEEFRKMYSEIFWKSYLAINKHISENCLFLKDWDNQITIKDFKVIFDKIQDGIFKIEDVRQALLDLDGSKQAKEKYNSVYHGLNVYINTILRSKNR